MGLQNDRRRRKENPIPPLLEALQDRRDRRQIDFDLDSMQTFAGVESTAVVVRGVRGGEKFVYSFLVREFDGRLQAGDLRESFVEENLGGR